MLCFDFKDIPNYYPDAKIVVTDYETGCWCGSGWALTLENDGKVRLYNLGHCSCYGPWDNGFDSWENIDDMLENSSSVTCTVSQRLVDKLLELVREL